MSESFTATLDQSQASIPEHRDFDAKLDNIDAELGDMLTKQHLMQVRKDLIAAGARPLTPTDPVEAYIPHRIIRAAYEVRNWMVEHGIREGDIAGMRIRIDN